jgi:tRNA(fMet)-specific endonuclease VapC
MFLLDANICVHIMNQRAPMVAQKFQQENPDSIALCSVVKSELLYGAYHSQRIEDNLALLERFIAPLTSFPFDDACAEKAGVIRAELARKGQPIGPNDLLIAATALANNLTLVTHNTREFARVNGLALEDWEL